MTPDRLAPAPLPDLDRMALRLNKGRTATPREWVDPLAAMKDARERARYAPDFRPAPGANDFADAYRQLRNRIPRTANRLRMMDLLAYSQIVDTLDERGEAETTHAQKMAQAKQRAADRLREAGLPYYRPTRRPF